MKTDKPLIAMLIGIAGGPIFEIYTQIMKHLGFTTLATLEVLSLMWLKTPSLILGILAETGIGSWSGLIMYLSVKFFGEDYFPIKTMFIGMTIESLVFNIFGTLGKNDVLMQNVSGNFVHASAAAIVGLFRGFLIEKFILRQK